MARFFIFSRQKKSKPEAIYWVSNGYRHSPSALISSDAKAKTDETIYRQVNYRSASAAFTGVIKTAQLTHWHHCFKNYLLRYSYELIWNPSLQPLEAKGPTSQECLKQHSFWQNLKDQSAQFNERELEWNYLKPNKCTGKGRRPWYAAMAHWIACIATTTFPEFWRCMHCVTT